METVWSFLVDHPFVTAGVAVVPVVVAAVGQKLFKSEEPLELTQCPPDTVCLYQIPRGPYAPSLTPFTVKLETYLRMAGVPYINDHSFRLSSRHKSPWMTYNGEIVEDSQFCIEYLREKRGVDLMKGLSVEEKAVAEAIRVLVDEHLYWTLIYFRMVHDKKRTLVAPLIPNMLLQAVVPIFRQQVWNQGIGRHTLEQIKQIMMSDLQVLADFLGNKEFIMGKTPCETDCAIFGQLTQWIWHSSDDVMSNVIQAQFPSLHQYCLRMKEKFWPDWDDCITHGGTREATK